MIESEAEARGWFETDLGISAKAMAQLEHLAKLLTEENQRQNLVSKGSIGDIWVRHFADSAQLLRVPRGTIPPSPWLDLGTGAGFPGLVIAICRPDVEVHMAESRRLRTDWLRTAVAALELGNATVIQSRIEALPDAAFATISARAFAPLDKLIEISARFSTPATIWLLPKGAKAEQELSMLSNRWNHAFHVEQSITDPNAGIVSGRLLGQFAGK